MIDVKGIKAKTQKLWQRYKYHHAYLAQEDLFPLRINWPRPSDKQWLHQYSQVQAWVVQLQQACADNKMPAEVHLIQETINYPKMGRQRVPIALEFAHIEALARYLGQWGQWQQFTKDTQLLREAFPQLEPWLQQCPAQVVKYAGVWGQLVAVCQYFIQHPKPNCYMRQLEISGVDTKFIETHKAILKLILDQLLPASAIDERYSKLAEQGFEKRFGLHYDPPLIRLRLLDPALQAEVAGLEDLSVPVAQLAQMDLMVDRVFITENKVNGLAFPPLKNSIVIFGLGYGVQLLKQVNWLQQCKIYYWGDIDTHGFAILSQVRSYFANTQSILMHQQVMLACKSAWGVEELNKIHAAESLPNLTAAEQQIYQGLKHNHWQPKLRLEQERIPMSWLTDCLATMK